MLLMEIENFILKKEKKVPSYINVVRSKISMSFQLLYAKRNETE